MPERRKLKIAERQIMLARIARRETMSALAGAIDSENKSAALADRSRQLLHSYGAREDVCDGQGLREIVTITGGLAKLAGDADVARGDARNRAAQQADALAAAENRLKRLEQRAHRTRRAMMEVKAARQQDPAPQMAQKLLKPDRPQSGV